MRTNIYIRQMNLSKGLLFLALLFGQLLFGQNNALHFDGDNDFITRNSVVGLVPTGDFTVQMWFLSTATTGNGSCFGDFRRLFSMGAAGPNRFEVGECNGILSVNLSGPGIIQSSINVRDNQWHCISVVRVGGVINIYLDGTLVPPLSALPGGSLVVTNFIVGHWPGGFTPGQDWRGYIDEVKLWNIALASAQLTTCNPCVMTGAEPGLIVYWRFDEGIPGGNNTTLTTVVDASLSGSNPGTFSVRTASIPPGFDLGFTTASANFSNFVNSTAPLVYPQYTNHTIGLSDPLQTINLISICSGDPVHFSILDPSGNPTQAGAGTSVAWEYSDDCLNWTPMQITATPTPSAVFSGFTFVSPPNHPSTSVNCSSNPNGFVDRCYRAIITVTNTSGTCKYTAQSIPLRICCPVSATLSINPPGPLCAGDIVAFTATVTTNLPAPSSTNNVHINWCVIINGVTTTLTGLLYDDQVTINYPTFTVSAGQVCFKAVVSNCACAPVTVQKCVTVDPKPVCGTITGATLAPTLYPDPDGNPDHYVICPFDDAAVKIVTPNLFANCIPNWQYMFPSVGIWKDLGSSNSSQNTNVLPHLKPAGSPYLWPAGETCIVYRIECVPPTNPSGCPPCYSNEVRVCLKSVPVTPVITANPNPICKGSFSLLSVQNPLPSTVVTYDWYCNGLYVGSGPTYNASKKACYWVTATDVPACQTSISNQVCLEVCETVAIISCPLPVCPCVGDPITLTAIYSYSTCGGPLTYVWSWIDGNGVPQTASTASITDIPAAAGTTYTVTVTDANGCTDTVSTTIVPCDNN